MIAPQDMEHRVSVLLTALGPDVADALVDQLPPDRRQKLRERLAQLRESPPSRTEIQQVLQEFQRVIRVVKKNRDAGDDLPAEGTARKSPAKPKRPKAPPSPPKIVPQELSDDPFIAITQMSDMRLTAALRSETSRTVALVLSCLPESTAGCVLQQLDKPLRDATVLQLKEKLTPPRVLLKRLLEATLSKCQSFVDEELEAERADSDARVARLLRTMTPQRRGEVLEMLEGADPDAAERIRDSLFSLDDLLRVEDRSLQRILSEVDGGSLATALSAADPRITERILGNLSKRAREGLEEAMSLRGNLPPAQLEEAQKNLLRAMIEVDKVGELTMKDAAS